MQHTLEDWDEALQAEKHRLNEKLTLTFFNGPLNGETREVLRRDIVENRIQFSTPTRRSPRGKARLTICCYVLEPDVEDPTYFAATHEWTTD